MGSQMAFGQFLNPVYKFDQADVVLSIDGNFLANGPGGVRYARDFVSKRIAAGRKHDAEPFLRGRNNADLDRMQGGSSSGDQAVRSDRVRSISRRGIVWRGCRERSALGNKVLLGAGERSAGGEGQVDRDRGRRSVAGSSRGRPLHQSGAGQQRRDGDIHARRSSRNPSISGPICRLSCRTCARARWICC